jgi:hypothetical protein
MRYLGLLLLLIEDRIPTLIEFSVLYGKWTRLGTFAILWSI